MREGAARRQECSGSKEYRAARGWDLPSVCPSLSVESGPGYMIEMPHFRGLHGTGCRAAAVSLLVHYIAQYEIAAHDLRPQCLPLPPNKPAPP